MPIGAPSLLRLFAHDGPLSGLRLGFVLLAALGSAAVALAWSTIRPRGPDGDAGARVRRARCCSGW